MGTAHGKRTVVLIDEHAMSGHLNNTKISAKINNGDTTTYGATAHTRTAGLGDAEASYGGYFDGGAGAIDAVLNARYLTDVPMLISVGVDGLAVGQRVRALRALLSDYTISSKVADPVPIEFEVQTSGPVGFSRSLHPLVAETVTGNGVSFDHGAATVNGGFATLHVTAASVADTLDVKVQHSADNSVWVDLVSFPQVSTVGAQRVSVAGTVNRWLREVRAIAGTGPSFTYHSSFYRAP